MKILPFITAFLGVILCLSCQREQSDLSHLLSLNHTIDLAEEARFSYTERLEHLLDSISNEVNHIDSKSIKSRYYFNRAYLALHQNDFDAVALVMDSTISNGLLTQLSTPHIQRVFSNFKKSYLFVFSRFFTKK